MIKLPLLVLSCRIMSPSILSGARRIRALFNLVVVISWPLLLTACGLQADRATQEQAAMTEILALHNAQRSIHFDKDSTASANLISDAYIAISRGNIRHQSVSEFIARRKRYYDSVEFLKWDDITPPIVRFSDDFTLAYKIVHKEVLIRFKNEAGDALEERTEFAWTTIYRKTNDGWKIEAATSTNKPETIATVDPPAQQGKMVP